MKLIDFEVKDGLREYLTDAYRTHIPKLSNMDAYVSVVQASVESDIWIKHITNTLDELFFSHQHAKVKESDEHLNI